MEYLLQTKVNTAHSEAPTKRLSIRNIRRQFQTNQRKGYLRFFTATHMLETIATSLLIREITVKTKRRSLFPIIYWKNCQRIDNI